MDHRAHIFQHKRAHFTITLGGIDGNYIVEEVSSEIGTMSFRIQIDGLMYARQSVCHLRPKLAVTQGCAPRPCRPLFSCLIQFVSIKICQTQGASFIAGGFLRSAINYDRRQVGLLLRRTAVVVKLESLCGLTFGVR